MIIKGDVGASRYLIIYQSALIYTLRLYLVAKQKVKEKKRKMEKWDNF